MKADVEWIQGLPNVSSAKIVQLISSKVALCEKDSKQFMFPSSVESVLQERCTEKIRHVMRASLVFNLFAQK